MAGKLKRFSATTQKVLKQLACLGTAAEIAILALVYGETEKATHAAVLDVAWSISPRSPMSPKTAARRMPKADSKNC